MILHDIWLAVACIIIFAKIAKGDELTCRSVGWAIVMGCAWPVVVPYSLVKRSRRHGDN